MRAVLTNGTMLDTPAVDVDLQCDDATRAIAKHSPYEEEDASVTPVAPKTYPSATRSTGKPWAAVWRK